MFALAAVTFAARLALAPGWVTQAAGGTETTVNRSARATKPGRFDAFDLAARGESARRKDRRDAACPRCRPLGADERGGAPIAWRIVGGRDAAAGRR